MPETFSDAGDEPVPLSALQHYLFCPRQCALIHVERLWAENADTAAGRILHQRADRPGAVTRKGVRIERAVPLRSRRLGVSGMADVVEFHRDADGEWPCPVEYKRGRPKAHRADEVQLCAQAMALEEMTGRDVREGALFYGTTRRRRTVAIDAPLRALTAEVAAATTVMIADGVTPSADYQPSRCDRCSLFDHCLPRTVGKGRGIAAWIADRIGETGS